MSNEVDFGSAEKGSDLWLFYQITDFGKDWEKLVVLLTPGFEGKTWYEKLPSENKLIIYGIPNSRFNIQDSGIEVSYRLTAPRFDWQNWPTLAKDQNENASFNIKIK